MKLPTFQSADAMTQWLLSRAVNGLPMLESGPSLAASYLDNARYADAEARAAALVRWESSKTFAAGFVTALGSAITLPIALPAALGASWLLQARMATALAHMYGHDANEPWVQTGVLMSLTGVSTPEAVRRIWIRAGEVVAGRAVEKISEASLRRINQRIGFKLLSSAGERGALRLSRAVPVAGAMFAGAVDAYDCHAVAKHARRLFSQPDKLLMKEASVLV